MKLSVLKLSSRPVKIIRHAVVLLLLIQGNTAFSQNGFPVDSLFTLPDTVRPFTIENFYKLVTQNHPVARQVQLLSENARQEIRMARGNFDPKLEADFLTKVYKDKEYYSLANGSVKIPTVLPLETSIGVQRNSGPYLNPENYIDQYFNYQQFYAGFSIPLGRGLITDDRRTALRQAALFKEMTEAEQVKQINTLLLEAANAYWQWYYAYYNYRLLNQSTSIVAKIFGRVKVNFQFGEASVMDTVQAKITWQQRSIEQQEAFLGYQNSGISLSNFLWDSTANPLVLDTQWVPVMQTQSWISTSRELHELTNQARQNHPELQKLNIKMKQLVIERKLAREYLKPRVNLNYYLLNQPLDPEWNASLPLGGNYKLGVDFSLPLFLRKERAKVGLANLKITNTRYDLMISERDIVNQLNSTYNQLVNLQTVMTYQRDMVTSYERLLASELFNLEQGESDLFRINLQQEKLISAQTKWLKMQADFEKQKAFLHWAAGSRPAVLY